VARHAILLADREWCEAASSGRVRVYDFIKPRKRRIRALTRGSVCVVVTKARAGQPQVFYGEFTVTGVKEVDAGEYGRLVREGLIHSPQVLKPHAGVSDASLPSLGRVPGVAPTDTAMLSTSSLIFGTTSYSFSR